MKRTVPGGRVESIYTQSKNGKEVIATTITPADVEEAVEVIEEEVATPATSIEEEPESKEQ